MGEAAIQLAPGVFRFPTAGDYVNTIAFVEADGSVTLVDTGYKKATKKIVAGLSAMGKSVADVQRILLTHAHNDHAGAAAEMVDKAKIDGVEIHEVEVSFAEAGESPPLDQSLLMGKILSRLPAGTFAPVAVSGTFKDGDLLDVAGGLEIHHTPGHSPGHVSMLHKHTNTLITGDSIWNMASRMSWPVPFFCTSHKLNKQTAHVLGELDYDVVAFTHGTHIDSGAREAVRGFLKRKDAW